MSLLRGQRLMVTDVLRRPVLGSDGNRLGSVEDVIARLADGGYPRIAGLKVRVGQRDVFVPANVVTELGSDHTQLSQPAVDLGRFERRAGEVLLREDVLGRRLIDVREGRLVRADDLALAEVNGEWRLIGLDPGTGRRIGGWLSLGARQTDPNRPLLDWSDVQPFVAQLPVAGLFMPLGSLKKLHPAQIADLVERSSHAQGEEIIEAVEADPALAADVFEELDQSHREEFLEERSDAEVAYLLANMDLDDAVDALNELEQNRRLPVLELMPEQRRKKMHALLQYHPSTAGGMMSPDYIAVQRGGRQADVLDTVRADRTTPVPLRGSVFVTQGDGRFIGAVSLVDAVRAESDLPIEEWPALVTVHVHVTADVADVAVMLTDYNLNAIGVTDASEALIGAISVDDVLEAMLPEEWRRRSETG